MINGTERLLKTLTNNAESHEEAEHGSIYNPSISRRRQLDQEFKALRRLHSSHPSSKKLILQWSEVNTKNHI